MSRRSRIVGFGSAALLVVAGIACAFAFSGTLGQNLAFALVALGLVLATSLIFYEVGLTEDRERAREQAAVPYVNRDSHRHRQGSGTRGPQPGAAPPAGEPVRDRPGAPRGTRPRRRRMGH